MNCKPWTVALIGAGLVSFPAVIRAEEKPSPLQTAVAGTTISGFVDTSAHWNFGTGNQNLPLYAPNGQSGSGKADGFNLDVMALTISKAPGEEPWSAGYNATLLFGPDANGYNTSFLGSGQAAQSDFALKDTYVDLHAPIGNGLDVKLGTFAEPLGYEVYEAGNNPNYTRSYGYEIEPTSLTGVIATYQVCPALTVNGGIANTWSAGINSRATPAKAESFKTYIGNMTFTAPTNWGSFAGSTISGGVISGWDAGNGVDKTSFYAGGTFNTPCSKLKVGVSYDYAILGPNTLGADSTIQKASGYQNATGLYVIYQATDKLSFNTRGEYFSQSDYLTQTPTGFVGLPKSAFEVTETIQYDLWKNVVSRLEFRWDHAADDSDVYSTGLSNTYMVAANLIYKF